MHANLKSSDLLLRNLCFEQLNNVRAVGVKKVVINVTVLCQFLLFFILFSF